MRFLIFFLASIAAHTLGVALFTPGLWQVEVAWLTIASLGAGFAARNADDVRVDVLKGVAAVFLGTSISWGLLILAVMRLADHRSVEGFAEYVAFGLLLLAGPELAIGLVLVLVVDWMNRQE